MPEKTKWEEIKDTISVRAKVQELIDAAAADGLSFETVKEIMEDAKVGVNRYTNLAKVEAYDKAKASGNPMHYACIEYFFPTIRIKETTDDNGLVIRTIEETSKHFDLANMAKEIQNFGADKHWINAAEKFNGYLCIRVAKEIGADIKNKSLRMKEASRDYKFGSGKANPTSNTQLLNTLNEGVGLMLGAEYKATSHDVAYLLNAYGYDNKRSKTSYTTANHKELRTYLKKVCRHILTGQSYEVDNKDFEK